VKNHLALRPETHLALSRNNCEYQLAFLNVSFLAYPFQLPTVVWNIAVKAFLDFGSRIAKKIVLFEVLWQTLGRHWIKYGISEEMNCVLLTFFISCVGKQKVVFKKLHYA
jgi:hypothetical protein